MRHRTGSSTRVSLRLWEIVEGRVKGGIHIGRTDHRMATLRRNSYGYSKDSYTYRPIVTWSERIVREATFGHNKGKRGNFE